MGVPAVLCTTKPCSEGNQPMETDNRSTGRRWLDFWFSKADPTTLGFMRVVTGVLVVYIHLAYSFDLQSFFGENGWYRLSEINDERTQYPWTMVSFRDWADPDFVIPAYIPEYAHRRKPVMEWYRELAKKTPAERKAALAYVNRLQQMPSLSAPQDGLRFAERIPQHELAQKARLDLIVDPNLRTIVDNVPLFIETMSLEDRKALRDELAAFLASLPSGPDHRRYVLNHLTEIQRDQRRVLLKFLEDLPADQAESTEWLNFLEKWNNEKRKARWLGEPIFSIWFHVTDPTEMAITHTVILGIMIMFTLGLYTKVTSVLTWLAAVSYIHRTQQVLFGMDTMMNLLLIYLMIGPSGAALSLDRWRAKKRAEKLSRERNSGELDPLTQEFLAAPPQSVSAGFVMRLLQIHFCFIYMAAGLSKLKGAAWWNHNAYWDTLANPEFTMIQFQFYENLLRNVVAIRPVYAFMAAGVVIFTFFLEIGLPFLVWTRLRPYIALAGVLFHFGIAMFMGLNIFGLLMMTLLLCYIPGEVIHRQLFPKGKA